MRIRFFIILFIVEFLQSCNVKRPTIDRPDKTISINLYEKYKFIDSLSRIGKFSEFKIKYYEDDDIYDTLFLTLSYSKSGSKILRFPEFNVTGVFTNYSNIYFNEQGKPFAIGTSGSKKTYQLLLFDITKGLFSKSDLNYKHELNNLGQNFSSDLNKQCEIENKVDILMHRFSSLGIYSSTKCLNTIEDYQVINDSVPIYKDKIADPKNIIRYLNRKDRIKYSVACSTNFKIGNEVFFWVEVKVSSSLDSGWVLFSGRDFIPIKELD